MTPDWDADGTAAADALIRRLEFPIKAAASASTDDGAEAIWARITALLLALQGTDDPKLARQLSAQLAEETAKLPG